MSATTSLPFSFPASLSLYNTSLAEYLSVHPSLTHLVTSALITCNSRVLLIQRAAHDGFPLKWECPGGCVDISDTTILNALSREVGEETGARV